MSSWALTSNCCAHRVFAHIAHDVGELKGESESVRVVGGLGLRLAKDARRHLAHHASHQVAVLLQVGEIEIAVLFQVHLATVDHGEQVPGFNAECVRVRHQGLHDRVIFLPRVGLSHLTAPPGELGLGHADIAHLVHHVVHLAAKGVKRGDGSAPLGRQEEECVIKTAA